MSNLSKGGTKKDTKMRIRAFPVSAPRSQCACCLAAANSITVALGRRLSANRLTSSRSDLSICKQIGAVRGPVLPYLLSLH